MHARQALVIGNEAYRKSPIRSCVNDAADVSMTLSTIGFQVHPATNLTAGAMDKLTDRFIESVQPGSIVIFYFSGHGIQHNGLNYLLGIDDENLNLDTLNLRSLNVQRTMDSLHARNPRLVLFILDACRGYEVEVTTDGARFFNKRLFGVRDGLAPIMQAPPATIIVYACAEDQFSSALSMNDRNSLYTFHLLRHICTPNCDIDMVLRNIAADVQRDPLNLLRQVPFRYSSLNEPIYLVEYGGMNAPMSPMGWQQGLGYRKSCLSISTDSRSLTYGCV